jgi:hypothetical protein
MSRSRFQPLGVERRGGRPVARIFDSVLDEEVKVYRRGRSFLRWDEHDLRVENAALKRVAREALEGPA